MVEDRITDGKRIAQLLSSELSGRESGPLGPVSVVDADPDAEPTADGTEAYGIAFDGARFGTVSLYPDHATVRLDQGGDAAVRTATTAELPTERDGDTVVLRVESGVAVKRAVDAIAAAIPAE